MTYSIALPTRPEPPVTRTTLLIFYELWYTVVVEKKKGYEE